MRKRERSKGQGQEIFERDVQIERKRNQINKRFYTQLFHQAKLRFSSLMCNVSGGCISLSLFLYFLCVYSKDFQPVCVIVTARPRECVREVEREFNEFSGLWIRPFAKKKLPLCACVCLCVCLAGIAANYKPGHTLAHRAALQCSQAFCAKVNLLLYNSKRSLSTGCCVKCGATERVQPLQL